MNAQPCAFDGSLGGEVGHLLEGCDVLGAAVGITRVVDGIDSDKEVPTAEHLGPGQSQRQHDGIACRHIGDRNARLHTVDGNGDAAVGQRRTTEDVEPQRQCPVLAGTERCGNSRRGPEFDAMTLAVIDRQTMTGETAGAGDRQRGCGVEPTGEEDDGRPGRR